MGVLLREQNPLTMPLGLLKVLFSIPTIYRGQEQSLISMHHW